VEKIGGLPMQIELVSMHLRYYAQFGNGNTVGKIPVALRQENEVLQSASHKYSK
jgi:hypothetical protein